MLGVEFCIGRMSYNTPWYSPGRRRAKYQFSSRSFVYMLLSTLYLCNGYVFLDSGIDRTASYSHLSVTQQVHPTCCALWYIVGPEGTSVSDFTDWCKFWYLMTIGCGPTGTDRNSVSVGYNYQVWYCTVYNHHCSCANSIYRNNRIRP